MRSYSKISVLQAGEAEKPDALSVQQRRILAALGDAGNNTLTTLELHGPVLGVHGKRYPIAAIDGPGASTKAEAWTWWCEQCDGTPDLDRWNTAVERVKARLTRRGLPPDESFFCPGNWNTVARLAPSKYRPLTNAERASLSRSIRRLRDAGLVCYAPVRQKFRRAIGVRLTDSGRVVVSTWKNFQALTDECDRVPLEAG